MYFLTALTELFILKDSYSSYFLFNFISTLGLYVFKWDEASFINYIFFITLFKLLVIINTVI